MEKKYFSIKEVSQMLDLPASTLRFWEKEISMLSPQKSRGGVRRYVHNDIELLKTIKSLIEIQHLTLIGVNERLEQNSSLEDRRRKVIARLISIKKELQAIRRELNLHEAFETEFFIEEDKG
jgi:DNA-binding transcriptional MerR regulator